MIMLVFLKDHHGCCVENRTERILGAGSPVRKWLWSSDRGDMSLNLLSGGIKKSGLIKEI